MADGLRPVLPGISVEDARDFYAIKQHGMAILERHENAGGALSDRMKWYASLVVLAVFASMTGDEDGEFQEALENAAKVGLPDHPNVA